MMLNARLRLITIVAAVGVVIGLTPAAAIACEPEGGGCNAPSSDPVGTIVCYVEELSTYSGPLKEIAGVFEDCLTAKP